MLGDAQAEGLSRRPGRRNVYFGTAYFPVAGALWAPVIRPTLFCAHLPAGPSFSTSPIAIAPYLLIVM